MPSHQINQISLIAAITKHLEKQEKITHVLPREIDVIIRAADLIVAELTKPNMPVTPGMGIDAWRESDGTGTSSQFMDRVLAKGWLSEDLTRCSHPQDPSDFGRCVGLLDAAPELRPLLDRMSTASPQWKSMVDNWIELEALYREELPSGSAPKLLSRMYELEQIASAVVHG